MLRKGWNGVDENDKTKTITQLNQQLQYTNKMPIKKSIKPWLHSFNCICLRNWNSILLTTKRRKKTNQIEENIGRL